jgi:hypothetical protein
MYDGRSGSVFLQSLLDHHPEVSTFPATSVTGGVGGSHINHFLIPLDLFTWDQVVTQWPERFSILFDSTEDPTFCRLNELGPEKDESFTVNVGRFQQLLLELTKSIPCEPRSIFLATHLAWEGARGRHFAEPPVIVHALHMPDRVMVPFCRAFPEAKHMLCVRNPIRTYASHFNHHLVRHSILMPEQSFWLNGDNADYALSILRGAISAYGIIAANIATTSIRAVRLEDIHADPRMTMDRVCRWLGIQFDQTLLTSTFAGKLHWGDRSIPHKTGPSVSASSYDWRQDYYWHDVVLLERLFLRRMRGYGYEPISDVESIPWQEITAALRSIMRWEVRCWSGIAQLDEATAFEQLSQKLKVHTSQGSRFGAITRWIKQFSPTMLPTEMSGVEVASDFQESLECLFNAVLQRIALCEAYLADQESEISIPLV